MLTARTLYTYKYEVAINNDKVHRSASSFLSRDLFWSVTSRRASRAPFQVAPVRLPSGRPTCSAGRRTLRFLRTQVPHGTRCYERARRRWLVWSGAAGAFFSIHSPWKAGIGASGVPSSGFLTRPNDNYSLNLDYLLLNDITI